MSRSLARRSQADGEDIGPHLEVVDLDVVHLGHVHVVAIGIERVRIEALAEEAGRAAFADDVALLQRPRQHDERQHRLGGRLEADDLRAEVGEVLAVRRLELARGADLVGRVAGHHLVDGGRVVEQAVRRVGHRADHREPVVHLRELRQDFGEVDAGDLRADVFERAADVLGRIRFWIPQVEMARSALEVDHDDALGFAPTGAAAGGCGRRRGCARGLNRLQFEQRAERQAEHAGAADAEDVAPARTQVSIAEILGLGTDDSEHGGRPL